MSVNKVNIRMQRNIFSGNIEVQYVLDNGREFYIPKPLELVGLAEGDIAPPFMSLSPSDAQQMMDELWNCGIRPSEGTGSAGSLAATERHLADMQKIAFKLLKM